MKKIIISLLLVGASAMIISPAKAGWFDWFKSSNKVAEPGAQAEFNNALEIGSLKTEVTTLTENLDILYKAHNDLIAKHNELLKSHNLLVEDHNKLLKYTNDKFTATATIDAVALKSRIDALVKILYGEEGKNNDGLSGIVRGLEIARDSLVETVYGTSDSSSGGLNARVSKLERSDAIGDTTASSADKELRELGGRINSICHWVFGSHETCSALSLNPDPLFRTIDARLKNLEKGY